MSNRIRGLLAALVVLTFTSVGCAQFKPVAASVGEIEGATPEHVYLAGLEDYRLFAKDVNAYIALPSTSREEALKIDAELDKADLAVKVIEIKRANGTLTLDAHSVALNSLQLAQQAICLSSPAAAPACAVR